MVFQLHVLHPEQGERLGEEWIYIEIIAWQPLGPLLKVDYM